MLLNLKYKYGSINPMVDGTKYYEISYLINPTISQDEALVLGDDIKSLLGRHGAVLESWDSPNRRRLAYPIQNHNEAYLGALRFTAPRVASQEISESLDENKNIIRFMHLGWKRTPPRKKHFIAKPVRTEEETQIDQKTLDEKLDEILGQTHESQ